jgi:hypothetical protein
MYNAVDVPVPVPVAASVSAVAFLFVPVAVDVIKPPSAACSTAVAAYPTLKR